MTYSLQIDLIGGEKVESILQKLQGLTGVLGQVVSIFGGDQSGCTSPIEKQVDDIGKLNTALQKNKTLTGEAKKESQSLATNLAQGFSMSKFGNKNSIWSGLNPKILSMLSPEERLKTLKFQAEMESGGASGGGKGENPLLKKFREDLSAIRLETAKGLITMSPANRAKTLRSGSDLIKELVASNPDLGEVLQNNTLRMAAGWDKTALAQEAKANAPARGHSGPKPPNLAALAEKNAKDAVTFKKDMSFLMMPLFNPGSMWATLFSGRQTYSALNTGPGKAFSAKFLGGMGAGAGTATLVAGATALGLALKALTVTVKQTIAAYENARQIYAKALTNGMGTQFTVKRSMLAQIMGVSEQDVFRFGAQMAYLNPKLEWASNILAKTATPLTQVSWQFKVLQTDMSAMFAKIGTDFAPVANIFIDWIDKIIKKLTGPVHDQTKVDKFFAENPQSVGQMLKGIGLGLTIQKDTGKKGSVLDQLNTAKGKDKAKWFRVAKMSPEDAIHNLDLAKKWKMFDGGMPSPQAWMKQLPAAHWEKIGLVTMGGSANYAKDTARNTKDIANGIRTLVQNVIKNPGSSPWNMSPKTAQP